jgi:hypothetical protein
VGASPGIARRCSRQVTFSLCLRPNLRTFSFHRGRVRRGMRGCPVRKYSAWGRLPTTQPRGTYVYRYARSCVRETATSLGVDGTGAPRACALGHAPPKETGRARPLATGRLRGADLLPGTRHASSVTLASVPFEASSPSISPGGLTRHANSWLTGAVSAHGHVPGGGSPYGTRPHAPGLP